MSTKKKPHAAAGLDPGRRRRAMRRAIALPIAIMTALALQAGQASAGDSERHCMSPFGFDLNEFHATEVRIVTDFCTTVLAGEQWIPAVLWVTNNTHEVIPDGYEPSRPTPIEDFNAKVLGARYVVDAGTGQERVYTFRAGEILQSGLIFPGFDLPGSALLPVLRPLSVGPHTVDIFVTMSAVHWDGFGDDPAENRLPAGETHWKQIAFEVTTRMDI